VRTQPEVNLNSLAAEKDGLSLSCLAARNLRLSREVIGSIFAYDFYVPCLWREQEEFVQNCLAESMKGTEVHSPAWHLTRFPQYRGRGVLRRMLRELNNCVVWENDSPTVSVPSKRRGLIGVYSKLQEILTEKTDLFGGDVDRIDQARWDRWRLGLYYTLDWILATRGEPFSVANVQLAAQGLKLGSAPEWVRREDYAGRIIQMFRIWNLVDAASVIGSPWLWSWRLRRELSRAHLMVFAQEDKISIEVLSVPNSVRVNGSPVSRADLNDGDVLTIATLTIRVHIHTHEAAGTDNLNVGTPASP
jgi:hypothetical protein